MTKIGAVILAGGQSRRMGINKANLKIEGMTFLEKLAKELGGFEELLVSVEDAAKHGDISLPLVSDIYPDHGPMGGIYSALIGCESDALLAVNCDMPLFRREFGEYLAAQLDSESDAVVPVTDGRLHPLCAIYRKNCADVFAFFMADGDLKMLDALRMIKTKYVDIADGRFIEALKKNINTPEEYKALCEEVNERCS